MITLGTGAGVGFQNNPIQSPPLVLPQFRPPTLVTAPAITGGAVGQAAVASPAVWDAHPAPIVSGQWLLDGAEISGATGPAYTPLAGQVNGLLSYREAADNGVGTASALSNTVTITAANSAPVAIDVTLQFDVQAA